MATDQLLYLKTTAPTANDDVNDGYKVLDIWGDTTNDLIYQAIDVTAGAAVWVEVVGRTLDQTLTNKTLTTPVIGDFTNATHNHSSNATGGNINRGYILPLAFGNGGSPTDATTYYFGQPSRVIDQTTAGRRRIYVPMDGIITRATIAITNAAGTVGSAETSSLYFRLNNTTDTLLSSAVVNNQASEVTTYINTTGLSIAVVAGDYFEIKWVTPTWATNPTIPAIFVNLFVNT